MTCASHRIVSLVGVLAALVSVARPARAIPSQTIIFLGSNQRIREGYPQAALFGYYYGRDDVSLLGLYAGPRWTFGGWGVELKTGVYGGPGLGAHPIANNQIDFTSKRFSLTSFSDVYPNQQAYSYLSAYVNFDPLFLGVVSDFTADWSATTTTKVTGGPTIGAGTKTLYFGTSYLFSTQHTTAIRLTVGITI